MTNTVPASMPGGGGTEVHHLQDIHGQQIQMVQAELAVAHEPHPDPLPTSEGLATPRAKRSMHPHDVLLTTPQAAAVCAFSTTKEASPATTSDTKASPVPSSSFLFSELLDEWESSAVVSDSAVLSSSYVGSAVISASHRETVPIISGQSTEGGAVAFSSSSFHFSSLQGEPEALSSNSGRSEATTAHSEAHSEIPVEFEGLKHPPPPKAHIDRRMFSRNFGKECHEEVVEVLMTTI